MHWWAITWRRTLLWPIAHPIAAIVIAIAACLLAAAGASRLRPDSSIESMFATHDPASQALLGIMNRFGAAGELLILASTPDELPANPDQLSAFATRLEKQISDSADARELSGPITWRVDQQMRQFFEKELVPSGLFYLTDQQLEAARQRLTPEGMRQQIAQNEALIATPGPAAGAIAKVTLQDPLRLHEFILDRLMPDRPFQSYHNSEAFLTPDGKSLLIRIQGRRPPSDIDFAKQFCGVILNLAAGANTGSLRLEYAGAYPIAAASERAIRADMVASITSSVICLQLLFILAYRKPIRLFALAFLPVAMGVLLGFGVSAMLNIALTPMTAAIGAVLGGLAIDYSVYLISEYEAYRRMGEPPYTAATRSVLDVAPAVFAAWITSAMGFVAIGFSSIPAICQFSLLGTLGLSGAFFAAIGLLPALMSLTDRRDRLPQQHRAQMRLGTLPLLHLIMRFRRTCLALGVLLLVASVAILLQSREGILPMESDLTTMHPRPNPAMESQAKIAKRFGTSPDAMLLYLRADTPAQLVTLAHAARERLSAPQVKRQGGIRGTFGIADLLPDPTVVPARLEAVKKVDSARVVADFNAAIADSLFEPAKYQPYAEFLSTMLSRRSAPDMPALLKYPSLARNFLPRDAIENGAAPTEAIMIVFTANTLDVRQDRDAAIDAIRTALAGLSGVTLTGLGVLGHDTQVLLARDLPLLCGVAALAVVAYLLLHFRSVSAALLAVAPMAGSLLVLLAVARLIDQRLNMVNLVAAPLLIGIDVDYGIFLVSIARSRKWNNRESLARRIDSGTHAVLVCVASALLGFGTLYYTSVPAVASLGFAVGVGVLACMSLILLLVLPLLFAGTKEP